MDKLIIELDMDGELSCSETGITFGNIDDLPLKAKIIIEALIEERDELDERNWVLECEKEDLEDKVEELNDYVQDLRGIY